MNEKLSYAEMLDIPSSTSVITYKAPKTRAKFRLFPKKPLKKDHEEVKKELVEKLNNESEELLGKETLEQESLDNEREVKEEINPTSVVRVKEKKKKKPSVIAIQFAVIGLLLLAIFFTNALMQNSAINVFFGGVFGGAEVNDSRVFSDFTPLVNGGETFSNGVLSLTDKKSVYPPCDGKITSCVKEPDETFTVMVSHSDKFATLVSGLKYFYFGVGDSVYVNVPIGFSGENSEMCFTDSDGAVITGWTLTENEVKWAV
jgi:hypothetical protein